MHKTLKYLVLCFSGLIALSCKNTVPVQDDKFHLWRNEFKGNSQVHSDELKLLIPYSLRENSKPLNLPVTPRVWWYTMGQNRFDSAKVTRKLSKAQNELTSLREEQNYSLRKSSRLERKIERYEDALEDRIGRFWKNLGQPRVYFTEEDVRETAGKVRKYLFDLGFREAEVNYEITKALRRESYNIKFLVKENVLYTIDSVLYAVPDLRIDSLIKVNLKAQITKAGGPLRLENVELERLRIEQLLKSQGYYYFNSQYVTFGVTNEEESEELFKERKGGSLQFTVANPNVGKHVAYTVSEVSFKTFDPNTKSQFVNPDTTEIRDVKFIRLDNSVPGKTIVKRITTLPGQLYSNQKIFETQRQISLFNQFAFASANIKVADSSKLELEYFAPMQERFTFGISPGVNNIYTDGNSFFGFGVPVSLSMRNVMRKLEIVELGVRASYEGQPAPIRTSDYAIRGSLELGVNLNVTFPTLLPLNPKYAKSNLKNPRSTFGLGYNYSEPFWGTRTNFKLTAGHSLQLNRNTIWYFNFLDAYLINTHYGNNLSGREFYRTLDSLQRLGNNLKVTFDPQFVSSINSNYVFNNQDPSKPFSNSTFFRFFVESGGTFLNVLDNKERIGWVENLFPMGNGPDSVRAYFRFFKINADYRRSINLTPKSSYAFRVNVGVAHPYGKNKSIPFDKSFFVGGSNSVRAWAPRTLGTGSSLTDTTSVGNTIPQPGDILLEGSLEYRVNVLRFAGNIQLAAFLDAGNVWKWHQIDVPGKKDRANFDFRRFYKEIAVGTGFGVRWDLNFFLFRFDWGIKVIDPSMPEGDRYVLNRFNFRRGNLYGLNWNFGIGYPF